MGLWGVIARFQEDEVGELRVMTCRIIVTDGDAEFETARVLFNRAHSQRPDVSFAHALLEERDKAEAACDVVNGMLDKDDERRAQLVFKTRERVQKILGTPSGEPV